MVLTAELPAAATVTDLSTVRPPQEEMVSEQGRLAQLIIDGNHLASRRNVFWTGSATGIYAMRIADDSDTDVNHCWRRREHQSGAWLHTIA